MYRWPRGVAEIAGAAIAPLSYEYARLWVALENAPLENRPALK
jgi:hypothetical protein